MNKVYLIGRVTRDLELQHFGDGKKAFVKFTLAVNEYISKTPDHSTNFIDIVAFGRKAEILSQYIRKGHKLSLEGKIRAGSYLDKNNNNKYGFSIILDNFNFIDKKENAI